jgi:dipeptidyl aminopeptidase/acylaminoacyl peptidase
LVFERNAGDDNRSLWVYNLDTDSVTLLSQSHTDNSHPTWSPDGTKIAFTSWQSCGKDLDYCLPEEQFWDIMIVDADGGNLHAITDFRNTDFFSEDNDFSAKTLCNLNWSPDGQAIAFENSCLRGSFNPSHVFTVDIKTKLLFQATDFASTQIESDLSSDSESTTIFSYSTHWAESANMLYIGYSHSKYLSTNLDLFGGVLIVDKENHLTHQTTEILGLRSPMYWSPDTSKFIGFTIRLDNQRTISGPTYLGQLPTPNGTFSLTNISPKLPFGSCDDLRAFWAPDSQYVAYAITPEDRSCVDEELNRGVAIVSISDGRYINVAESIPGDNRPIGWMIIDE